ncbi:MAG: hypothetical protein JRJ43_11610 [Deltaproteobacteria bacterium]|nr:hypothetical protein [Deltaproteobacteria bacterium]
MRGPEKPSVGVIKQAGRTLLGVGRIEVRWAEAGIKNEKMPADSRGREARSGLVVVLSEAMNGGVGRRTTAGAAAKACHLRAAEAASGRAGEGAAVDVAEI